jgi:hypothetical protein
MSFIIYFDIPKIHFSSNSIGSHTCMNQSERNDLGLACQVRRHKWEPNLVTRMSIFLRKRRNQQWGIHQVDKKNPYTNQTLTSIILLAWNVRDLTRSKKNKTSQKLGYVLIHNQSGTHDQIMSHDEMNSHQPIRKYDAIVYLCLHILYYISYLNFSFPCRVFGYCKWLAHYRVRQFCFKGNNFGWYWFVQCNNRTTRLPS